MKLYNFNPNGYGTQYSVIAENKTNAHKYLITFFEKRMDNIKERCYIISNSEELKRWEMVNPLDPATFPERYTLDEHKEGEVIESENA